MKNYLKNKKNRNQARDMIRPQNFRAQMHGPWAETL